MFYDKRHVQEALLTVNGKGSAGEVFALVKFTDGSYGITRNSEVIEGLYFAQIQLDECSRHLLRLAQIADTDARGDVRGAG
jgi:hypothetical protein